MTTPSTRTIQDNLNIGLYLSRHPQGAELTDILVQELGYTPNGPAPTNQTDDYFRRFRDAQRVGRDGFRNRVPG